LELDDRKQWLRQMLGTRRRRLTAQRALTSGRDAALLLVADPGFAEIERLGVYAASADEIASRPLFEGALELGKELFAPRCRDDGALDFFRVGAWEDLQPGRYGLLEPDPGLPRVAPSALDWVVVPGVAFDARGSRLGRGAGYYDRTFPADAPDGGPALIGFGYEFQLIEMVPVGPLDRKMDAVATEEELLWVSGR